MSLDFGATSDLGLVAKCDGVDIAYKPGDFKWTIKSKTAGVPDKDVGHMDGNTFVAGTGSGTMNATVTVTYANDRSKSAEVSVEIGKLPVTLMDFEPINGQRQTCAHYHWGKSTYVDNGMNPDHGYIGNVSPITVTTGGTYSDNPKTAEISAPYRFTGNYDSAVPASDIFHANGYTYYLWPNGTMDQYLCGGLKTVTAEEGGQVRTGANDGQYSLELDYDYESYNKTKNANFYIRYSGNPIQIEGSPTEIGVWVYAPEGTPPYRICADIEVWDSAKGDYVYKNLFLTARNGSDRINWAGWMYCSAKTDSILAYQNDEHPLSILPGFGVFWLCYEPAAVDKLMGQSGAGRRNGTVYFDDYRVVYAQTSMTWTTRSSTT